MFVDDAGLLRQEKPRILHEAVSHTVTDTRGQVLYAFSGLLNTTPEKKLANINFRGHCQRHDYSAWNINHTKGEES